MSETEGPGCNSSTDTIQSAFKLLTSDNQLKKFTLAITRALALELDPPPPGTTALTAFLRQLEVGAALPKAASKVLLNQGYVWTTFLALLDEIHEIRALTGLNTLFAEEMAILVGSSALEHGFVRIIEGAAQGFGSYRCSIISISAILGILMSDNASEPAYARIHAWLWTECSVGLRAQCMDEINACGFPKWGRVAGAKRARVLEDVVKQFPK